MSTPQSQSNLMVKTERLSPVGTTAVTETDSRGETSVDWNSADEIIVLSESPHHAYQNEHMPLNLDLSTNLHIETTCADGNTPVMFLQSPLTGNSPSTGTCTGSTVSDRDILYSMYKQSDPDSRSLTTSYPAIAYDRLNTSISKEHAQAISAEAMEDEVCVPLSSQYVQSRLQTPPGSNLPKKYKCVMCAYRTRYKSDLNRHVRKHAVATFSCEICNMPFKTIGNVEFHKRREHPNLARSDTANIQITEFRGHMRKHGSSGKFHCDVCGLSFTTSGSMVYHKRTAHVMAEVEMPGSGLFSVAEVDEAETASANRESDSSLVRNRACAIVTDESEKTHIEVNCVLQNGHHAHQGMDSNCNNGLDYSGSVVFPPSDMPLNSDKGLKKKAGDDCTMTKDINTEHNQVKQNESKTNEDKYKCVCCLSIFNQQKELDLHLQTIHKMDTVLNSETIKTVMCSSGFGNEGMFCLPVGDVKYINKSRVMKYQCQYCAYGTMYKSTFDRHVRKHSLGACHTCDVCNMPFINIGHLLKHQRENHPSDFEHLKNGKTTGKQHKSQKTVKCPQCDFKTVDTNELWVHYDSEHTVTSDQSPLPDSETMQDSAVLAEQQDTVNIEYVPHAPRLPWQQSSFPFDCRQGFYLDDRVTFQPPTCGRYAMLVSDFDDFAAKPFACALCFFRTGDIELLVRHTENHLTGGTHDPTQESAKFASTDQMHTGLTQPSQSGDQSKDCSSNLRGVPGSVHCLQEQQMIRTASGCPQTLQPTLGIHSGDIPFSFQRLPCNASSDVVVTGVSYGSAEMLHDPHLHIAMGGTFASTPGERSQTPVLQSLSEGQRVTVQCGTGAQVLTKHDVSPMFSVHYKKDRKNKMKPYLCLICKMRFRHLIILKQHFKAAHVLQ